MRWEYLYTTSSAYFGSKHSLISPRQIIYLKVILWWQTKWQSSWHRAGKSSRMRLSKNEPKAHATNLYFLDISEYLGLFIKYQLVYQYLLLKSLGFLDNKILNVQFCWSSSILKVFPLLQSRTPPRTFFIKKSFVKGCSIFHFSMFHLCSRSIYCPRETMFVKILVRGKQMSHISSSGDVAFFQPTRIHCSIHVPILPSNLTWS